MANFGAGITVASLTVNSTTTATAILNINAAATAGPRRVTLTTGAEVATLGNGFTLTASIAPIVTTVSPNSGQQGQSLPVIITGQNTHFVQGTTTANFGAGITLASPLTINSATSATAVLNIDLAASIGTRNVTLTTGPEVATLTNGFTVLPFCASGKEAGVRISGVAGAEVISLPSGSIRAYNVIYPTPGPVLSFTSGDGINFSQEPGTRFALTSSQSVGIGPILSLSNGTYRTYFGGQTGVGGTYRIYSATSSDLLTWTQDSGIRVDVGGPLGCVHVNYPEVIQFPNGILRMYYSCGISGGDSGGDLLSATSTDGLNWTQETGVRLARGGNNTGLDQSLFDPHIERLVDGSFRMYYSGSFASPGVSNIDRIFSAVSTDGFTWKNEAGIRLDHGANGAHDSRIAAFTRFLPLSDGTVRLYYAGYDDQGSTTLLSAHWCTIGPNNPPAVVAGRNQTITFPTTTVSLNATASDDGVPAGAVLAYSWSQVSGPGTVTLSNPTALSTTAQFFVAGQYVLRLLVSDTQLYGFDDVTITVNPAATATISDVTPNTVQQGQQNLAVAITGQFTHFAQGTTVASFGSGITVSSLMVNSATTATALINIDPAAALGARTVTVTTGAEIATLANGFTVAAGTPVLLTVNPNTGQQGQQNFSITITGQYTHFSQGATQVSFGAGITLCGAVVTSATSLTAQISVKITAASGSRTITVQTGTEQVSIGNGFTVLPATQPSVLTWTQLLPTGTPPAVIGAELGIYNPATNRSVTWADRNGDVVFVLTGTNGLGAPPQWISFTPLPDPVYGLPTAWGSRLYDAANNRLMMFGGCAGNCGPTTADVWLLTNADGGGAGTPAWLKLLPAGSLPAARHEPTAVYDPTSNKLIVFGGQGPGTSGTSNFLSDVWVLSNANGLGGTPTWTQLNPAGNPPPGTLNATAVYDPANNQMVVFGGYHSQVPFTSNAVWILSNANGSGGPPAWTNGIVEGAPGSPPPRGRHSAVYDACANRMTIFGGGSELSGFNYPPGVLYNDTWVLANADGVDGTPTWIELNPTGGPPSPRYGDGMPAVLDVVSSRMTSAGDDWVLSGLTGVPEALLSVAPGNCQPGQTLTVTLTGLLTNFQQGPTQANFGAGITVTSLTVNSVTGATAVLNIDPAAAVGPRKVTLTTGTHTVSLDSGFTVVSVGTPILLLISPAAGQQGQQNLSINITGQNTNFVQGTTQGSFGAGITVATLTINSATSATAVLNIDPAAALGTRNVTLTTGAEVVSLASGFTVSAPSPAITMISPNSGPQGQGGPVGIVGLNTHFVQGTTQVSFGPGIAVSNITVTCPTCLTVQLQISPTAVPGPVTVTVTTASEVVSLANGFTILPGTPILTSLVPASAQQGRQNVLLTITGQFTHFAQGTTQVSLGAGVTVSNISVTSATNLTAQISVDPAATVGTRTLTVTTGSEVVSVANVFTVTAGTPIVLSLNPGGGQQGQTNLSVSIGGQFTHFVQGTSQVSFGAGVTVVSLTVASLTAATAVVNVDPAATLGPRTVTITTGSEIATFANSFTIISGGPTITLVNPNTAQQGQQSLSIGITAALTHFVQGTTQASFGAGITIASLTITSPTSTTAVVNIDPAATVGLRDVTLTTGSEVATLAGGFAVNTGAVITQINPNAGQQGQQNLSIAITGQSTHFVQGTTQANFGTGITVASLIVNSATTATAILNIDPAATVGSRNIVLTTGSEVVSVPSGFVVQTGAALLSISPTFGQTGTGGPVNIVGQNTHFVQGTTQLNMGAGITVNSVTVNSATSLSAQIVVAGNATPGARTVTVTTGSEVVSLTNGFNVMVNQPPAIVIAPTWTDALPNRVTITYNVNDDGLPLGGALTVSWQTISGPGNVGFQNQTLVCTTCPPPVPPGPINTTGSVSVGFDQPGTYVLQISASDSQLTTTQNVTVTVSGSVGPPPTVSIISPTDGSQVTSPMSVTGTVASAALSSWTLEYRMATDTVFQPLATGTTQVANGVLGTFDPSLLLNGIAYIQLRAVDASNQTTIAGPISVVVSRNLKVGIFTVSFNDLSVPVAGLPIQVVRTYDTRRRSHPGDFGYGWTLDLTAAQLAESVPLGDQWNETSTGGAFPNYCVQAIKAHVVTVTLTDGTTYQFAPVLNPNCQSLVPIQDQQVTITFAPMGATPPNAALAILGNNQPYVVGSVPGPVTLTDSDFITTFDPDQYLLTLPDGRTLQISMQSGLQKMTDLNGNTLTVTPAGITSSSGKSVSFARDAAQRITQITDPSGNSIKYVYNQVTGDLTSVTDRSNNTTTFTYDASHYLLTIVDPRGVQPIKNVYDASGRLIQHVDAFGNVINYNNNLSQQQEIVTDRLGNVTVNQYDTDGNIVQVTDALGGVTKRTYDSRDNLLTETNALNETRTYTYDANNNRLTETDPLGKTTTYTYNNRNQVLTIADALGRVTTNTYDANGNLLSTKDGAGNITSYTYNASGLRTSTTDALGSVTSYQYDGSGDLTQQTDPLGNVTTYTYDANGNKTSQTQTRTTSSGPQVMVTSYQYDAQSRVIKITYPDGSTTQIAYNSIGKQSVTTDQLGRQTSYQYDLMGRLTQTTYPDSTNQSATYDAEGDRITSTDRANRTTSYVYDPLKRLTKTVFPDSATTSTGYDAIGEVKTVTDARGDVTQYSYDAAGHRIQVTDALTHATSFAYDAVGNQLSMTDANGHTTQYQYDNDNRRTKVTYPDSTADSTAYDAVGRTVSKTDQAGLTTQFTYDKLGRLTQVTDASNQLTKYTYDELGNRITQTDANGHTTTFAYDNLGRRTKRTLPLGMSETSTYDAAGNLTMKTDFNGKTTNYGYDLLNRLTSKIPDLSFAAPTVSFTYTATSQRASMLDASGTTSYGYDLRDRLTQKATPEGTLSYTYDLAGNLTTIRSSNASGTTVNYTYDALNRLSQVQDNRLASGTTAYAYDNVGNLQGYTYPNSVQSAYTYNTLNRLTNLTVAKGTTLASYAYTLGPAGNRTQVLELGGRQVNYTYDALYRLTGETIAGGSVNGTIGYQYDFVGNRLQRTSTVAPVPATSYTYDGNDRLTTDTYDQDGNTTASGGSAYTYDFENQLKTQNGGAVTIIYDGDGNRVSKAVGGATTAYLVDDRNLTGYAQVLEEISGGAVQRVYTYGLNRISQSQASGTSFYGYDGHGNVRLLTDATGAVTDRYDYDAFGNIISQAGTTPNVYLYSGEQNDANLGLYYMRARYLSQSSGRFWTMDNLQGDPESPISLHKYAYVGNEPVVRIDPSGNQFDIASISVELASFDVLSSITTVNASSFNFSIKPLEVQQIIYQTTGNGLKIELGAFTRSRLPAYPEYRWVQFITTNDPLGGAPANVAYNDPQPPDDAKPFYYTDAEEPRYRNQLGYDYIFGDQPGRNAADIARLNKIKWHADLSLTGVAPPGGINYTPVVKISYGFTFDSNGVQLEPLTIGK